MKFCDLIDGVKNGNPVMEKQLYVILYSKLFKIPMSYCSDKEEATGVFNFSMVDIFSNLKNFKDEESLLKWSYRIIKNDCIDHVRKKTVYRNKLLNVKNDQIHKVSQNEGISSLRMEELMSCIQQLNDTHRLCFSMYEFDGFSHQEISEKLKININTSKWYLAEAKKELRKIIIKKGLMMVPVRKVKL